MALICEIMVDAFRYDLPMVDPVDLGFVVGLPSPPPALPPLPPRTGGIPFLTAIREGKLNEVRKQIFMVVLL